jgi:hypothetical protein
MFRTLALIVASALAGCVAQPGIKPLARDDPANPQAPEAPVASITGPLTLEPPPTGASDTGSPAPPTGSPMQNMEMKGMDMPGMPGMGQGHTPAASQPSRAAPNMGGMHHSHPDSAPQPAPTASLFTCKMHPQVVSDRPGNCPICGIQLVPKEGGK